MGSRSLWIVVGVIVILLLLEKPVFAVKPGAILSTKPEMDYARRIVSRVWQANGQRLTVTSGYDSTHQANSLHYLGLAEDYRTRDIPPSTLMVMITQVRNILGSDYDVILESDHLHVEYDPK